jgi:hypothetical protein
MNLYGIKRYRGGKEMAEGVKVTAGTDEEALKQAQAMYSMHESCRNDTFKIVNVYELPVPR